jgi:DNA-binding transcriptional MerR regulator
VASARIRSTMSAKRGLKGSELCRTLDIQPYVLRYWETEFKALQAPAGGAAGQRSYSETDVALVRRIKQLLYEEGYTIAGAKKKLESEPLDAVATPATAAEIAPLFESADAEPEGDESEGPAVPWRARQEAATSLDSGSEERIKLLRRGISEALAEAQSVLKILDKHPR